MMTTLRTVLLGALVALGLTLVANADEEKAAPRGGTSYAPVAGTESFDSVVKRMTAAKAAIAERHQALLAKRYDLADRAADGCTMSGGKPVQGGVRVRLPDGTTWDQLASMKPEEIRDALWMIEVFERWICRLKRRQSGGGGFWRGSGSLS